MPTAMLMELRFGQGTVLDFLDRLQWMLTDGQWSRTACSAGSPITSSSSGT